MRDEPDCADMPALKTLTTQIKQNWFSNTFYYPRRIVFESDADGCEVMIRYAFLEGCQTLRGCVQVRKGQSGKECLCRWGIHP